MHKKVLIAGGTGLLGGRLTALLSEQGYQVAFLSRNKNSGGDIRTYEWDLSKSWIEPGAVESAQYIINLAGAPVADHRWTDAYKNTIMKSRSESNRTIYQELKNTGYQPKLFLSSSGINYYGDDNGAHWLYESSPPGRDFLSEVCKVWEEEADRISTLGIRVVKLRTGVVLSREGGALPQLMRPAKFGLAAPVGSGEQFMSWIHIDDLCGIIIKCMQDDSMEGVYNGVAPEPEKNGRFMHTLADVMDKPYFAPRVPAAAIKLAMGSERSGIVLGSLRVSSEKAEKSGYKYKFPLLRPALSDLLS